MVNIMKKILSNGATVAEIDTQIEAIKQQITALESQQESIKQAIADQWGDDTSGLEAQYGQITVKIQAAGMVIEKLTHERVEAQKREIAMRAAQAVAIRDDLQKHGKTLYEQIETQKAQLAELNKQYSRLSEQVGDQSYVIDYAFREAEKLGVARADFELLVQAQKPTKPKK